MGLTEFGVLEVVVMAVKPSDSHRGLECSSLMGSHNKASPLRRRELFQNRNLRGLLAKEANFTFSLF